MQIDKAEYDAILSKLATSRHPASQGNGGPPSYKSAQARRLAAAAESELHTRRLAAAALTLALLALAGWPLGILAALMGTRAVRRGAGGLAVAAVVLGVCESALTAWVATQIITYQLHL